MPIYEYRCPDCGHEFEEFQKMSDPPVKVCPSCGEAQVKKLLSPTAFHLKGSGWYADHYGLKPGAEKKTDAGGKESSAPAPAADKAASKPAESSSAASEPSSTPAASTPSKSGDS